MNTIEVLKQYFGYDSFRNGQESIINAILEGRDTLAVMPTGAGKSICYQVPALMLPGVTLVISPLISLMQDQVKSLNENGIHAAYINSSLSDSQISRALEAAAKGTYKIIYVAPERLESSEFIRFASQVQISMVTVDEAHCISQWGQDFRPSYLKIIDFVGSLSKRPILSAFTATATEEVKNDIACILNLRNPHVVVTGFDRENLYYQVENIRRKADFIVSYIEKHPKDSGIIYCSTRKNVDSLHELLFTRGVPVTKYHAGLDSETRKKNQEDIAMAKSNMNQDILEVLLSEEQIRQRIQEMGDELFDRFEDKDPMFVGVLNGCFVFMADLVRATQLKSEVEFISVSSYKNATKSSGVVEITRDLQRDITDRNIIVVEDILDSGNTLYFLRNYLLAKGARSITIVTLLDKPSRREKPIVPDLAGFEVPDEFVVGFGLDYCQQYRNMPYIGVLKPEVYSK